MALSDSEILQLYKDPEFKGSFAGARTFQMFLKTDKNVDLPIAKIYSLLKQLPLYIMNQKRIRKFPRRKYVVTSFGQVMQADLGEMLPFNKFRYFLLLVDLFSRHMYVEPLRRKTTQAVRAAFERIFEELKSPIVKLETDQGSEFTSQANWFKEKKIVFKKKIGIHKASEAEHSIFLCKRKLYLILQSEQTNNWPKYIKSVVQHLNEAHVKKLGGVSPIEINSFLDDYKIRDAQLANSVTPVTGPTIMERRENEKIYKDEINVLKLGDLVYLDEKETAFTKQYKRKVSSNSRINNLQILVGLGRSIE
jgi:hypothetical protein